MNNYLVTFAPETDNNSKFAVSFRGILEDISPKWIQIFPFQIAIQTELSIHDLGVQLNIIAGSKRISIVRFDQWFTNEARSTDSLKKYNY